MDSQLLAGGRDVRFRALEIEADAECWPHMDWPVIARVATHEVTVVDPYGASRLTSREREEAALSAARAWAAAAGGPGGRAGIRLRLVSKARARGYDFDFVFTLP